jgi:hypothetical protein
MSTKRIIFSKSKFSNNVRFGVYKYFKNLRESLKDLNIKEQIFKNDLLLVDWFKDNINVSPNSIGFLRQHLVEGVIPTLLKEILETRIMIKSSMKKVLLFKFSIVTLLQFTKYYTIVN